MSFFKPTTAFSKTNRNLVLTLVLVWAIAIFGFHFLLRFLEKPTPEPALGIFEKAWPAVQAGNPTVDNQVKFADSLLSVLGKSSIISDKERRAVLVKAISWTVYNLVDAEKRPELIANIGEFATIRESAETLKDQAYVDGKAVIISMVAPVLKLKPYSIKAQILPFVLDKEGMKGISDEDKAKIPGIMKRYLIHYRSFLTDTNFLGFPFHYFYTAIFLLVLFVALCWIYSFKIDRLHTKMGTFDKKTTE